MPAAHPHDPRPWHRRSLLACWLACWLAAAFVAAACCPAANAQAGPGGPPAANGDGAPAGSASGLRVLLVTMDPGPLVWERFGHNALWVVDPAAGSSIAYNWGLFDFEQPYFIPRFLSGNTRYWMAGYGAREMIDAYLADRRSVTVQELRLTPAQRVAVRDYLAWNALPENRFYRYDYYRDNCSTRARDVIDRALGGRLRIALSARPTAETYRSMTLALVRDEEALATGMTLVLGEPADRPLTAWETAFIPMRLRDELRSVKVPDESGRDVPLVAGERRLAAAGQEIARGSGPPPSWPPIAIGILLAVVLLAAAGVRTGTRAHPGRGARMLFLTLGSAWCILAGLLGLVLVGAWTATSHFAMYRNENLLQFNPVAFATLPALWGARRAGAARFGLRAARLVAGLSVLGLLVQLLPAFDQVNGAMIGLALPVHVALALGIGRLRHAPARPGSRRPATPQ